MSASFEKTPTRWNLEPFHLCLVKSLWSLIHQFSLQKKFFKNVISVETSPSSFCKDWKYFFNWSCILHLIWISVPNISPMSQTHSQKTSSQFFLSEDFLKVFSDKKEKIFLPVPQINSIPIQILQKSLEIQIFDFKLYPQKFFTQSWIMTKFCGLNQKSQKDFAQKPGSKRMFKSQSNRISNEVYFQMVIFNFGYFENVICAWSQKGQFFDIWESITLSKLNLKNFQTKIISLF